MKLKSSFITFSWWKLWKLFCLRNDLRTVHFNVFWRFFLSYRYVSFTDEILLKIPRIVFSYNNCFWQIEWKQIKPLLAYVQLLSISNLSRRELIITQIILCHIEAFKFCPTWNWTSVARNCYRLLLLKRIHDMQLIAIATYYPSHAARNHINDAHKHTKTTITMKITLSRSQLRVNAKEGGKRSCKPQKLKQRRFGNQHDNNITKLPMLIFITDCFCVVFDFQVHFDCYLLHDGIYLCMKWHGKEEKRKMLLSFSLLVENRYVFIPLAKQVPRSLHAFSPCPFFSHFRCTHHSREPINAQRNPKHFKWR